MIANKLKAFIDSEFVKECRSLLKAAEIIYPEITSSLKLSVFSFFPFQTQQLIVEWFVRRYTVSSWRNFWRCVGMISCDWWECRRDRYWSSCSFYSGFQWELALSNWLVRKGKTCGAEDLSELADLLHNCGLTWLKTVGFIRDRSLAVISQSKC